MERHILIFRQKNSCSSEHGKLCFRLPEIISGTPKQLAARLKAREGLHSEVVAPESKKTGAKMNKWTAFYIQTASLKTVTVEKGNGFYSCFQSTANRIFSSFGIVLQDLFSVAVPSNWACISFTCSWGSNMVLTNSSSVSSPRKCRLAISSGMSYF